MIVYYKRMANAIMLLGAVLGGVFGLIYFHGRILNNPDKTAVFVWALWVFTGVIAGRLLAAMLAEYEIDESTAAADLDALLEQFQNMGLIEG